jgi:hypothetical protein
MYEENRGSFEGSNFLLCIETKKELLINILVNRMSTVVYSEM